MQFSIYFFSILFMEYRIFLFHYFYVQIIDTRHWFLFNFSSIFCLIFTFSQENRTKFSCSKIIIFSFHKIYFLFLFFQINFYFKSEIFLPLFTRRYIMSTRLQKRKATKVYILYFENSTLYIVVPNSISASMQTT